ncbi:MAG: hypothetical protein JWQ87_1555 [Candidatus Sulfotelmatobacter sp.]|nr:hypothetical protein [Candidatus Sulfotelmatobacter sp.]
MLREAKYFCVEGPLGSVRYERLGEEFSRELMDGENAQCVLGGIELVGLRETGPSAQRTRLGMTYNQNGYDH